MIQSVTEDWRFDASIDKKRKSITKNIICVPLKIGETCVGCLEIANKHNSEFKDYNYMLVSAIGRQLTLGIISRANSIPNQIQGKEQFTEKISQLTNENLLAPLLRNVLIILAEILKCEK